MLALVLPVATVIVPGLLLAVVIDLMYTTGNDR